MEALFAGAVTFAFVLAFMFVVGFFGWLAGKLWDESPGCSTVLFLGLTGGLLFGLLAALEVASK
jgi:uncharacterized membrane protein YeaQ/YmgE (transglycosylase-associated protein family)